MTTTIPEYDKEAWWQECLKAKPDLTRQEFENRWHAVWMMAQFVGAVRRKPQ